MDEQRIKAAVLDVLARSVDARALAAAITELATPTPDTTSERPRGPSAASDRPSPGASIVPGNATRTVLSRIVLDDILDDAILGAKPDERSFPLRLFFAELGRLVAADTPDGDGPDAHASEQAFTVASGLNFYFRAAMDDEPKVRLGLEVSRQIYAFAAVMGTEPDIVTRAAPLLATLMSSALERTRFESIDHVKVFDSQLHERTAESDPTASRIVRPATFLCRVAANNAVKAKAQVVT